MTTQEIEEKLVCSATLMLPSPHTADIDPLIVKQIGVGVTQELLTEILGRKVIIKKIPMWGASFNNVKKEYKNYLFIARLADGVEM